MAGDATDVDGSEVGVIACKHGSSQRWRIPDPRVNRVLQGGDFGCTPRNSPKTWRNGRYYQKAKDR